MPIDDATGGELIAAPRNGRDRGRSEQLAQRADLHLQVVLLDHHAGPHDFEQLVLGHQPIAPLVQRLQHVERARAELGRPAIDPQLPLGAANLDARVAEWGGGHADARCAQFSAGREPARGFQDV